MRRSGVDARLALPAAAAWLAAAVGCAGGAGLATRGLVVTSGTACVALLLRRSLLAAALVGACLGTASALAHVVALHGGPVADLARHHRAATVVARLTRDPVQRSGRGRRGYLVDATVLEVGGQSANAPVLVVGRAGGWGGLLPGQRVRMRARFAPPRAGDGIAAVALAAAPPELVGRPPWWQRAAGRIRAALRAACRHLPPDERGLVPGLVVGDVSAMPPSLTDAFRTSGLTHLNAVSGANCAIVVGAVLAVVRRSPLPRRARFAVAGTALCAFVVLARPSPSVLRAATMGAVALAGLATGRRGQALPLLAAAVLALLLLDPFLARAPGFALSVLATGAIVLLAPRWTDRLSSVLPSPVAAAVAVPAAAQLACTPVLVAAFGQVTPWAVVANLLAAPVVAAATVLGVLAALTAPAAPPVAAGLATLAAVPAGWLAFVARSTAALPGAHASWPHQATPLLLAAVAVVAAAVGLRLGHLRLRRLHGMLGQWPP